MMQANSFALDELGPMVEQATGPKKFLAIYCTSALTGLPLLLFPVLDKLYCVAVLVLF
jgi:membrane associated rhomboid family serine protease